MCVFESVTTIHGCGAVEHTESKLNQYEASRWKRLLSFLRREPPAGDCQRVDCINSITQFRLKENKDSVTARDIRTVVYSFRYEPAQCVIDCKFNPDKTDPGYALALTNIYSEIKEHIIAQATIAGDLCSVQQLRDEPI